MNQKIHKAFILGAGLGTRLKPLTDSLPKPLVPLYHEPMVNYAMRHCLSAGITDFAINTHHLPEAWGKCYPEGTFNGAGIKFFYEKVLLETGGGIKNIASFIGDEPLLVYNGDILTDLDIAGLMEAHMNSGDVATLALFPTGPNCNVAVEDGRIVDMRNARGVHPGNHQFTGIYCISPQILDLIPANEKISIVPAFLELIEQGKLGAYVSESATWHDLGSRASYFDAHQLLRAHSNPIDAKAMIDPSADICVESCVIGDGASIGKNARLRNSIIWPGAKVADNAELTDCIVRHAASGVHTGQDL
ncbi:MAG: sugar phosphate nucleotidyltransferase [Akkermansiaceae bacterium]